jgi:phosphoribosylformylglycinamidine cyclo-ligase
MSASVSPATLATLEAAGVSRRVTDRVLREVAPLLAGTDPNRRMLRVPSFCSAIDVGRGLALVTTADGVGTKRALMSHRPADLGRDLVAYNLNDVVTVGAQPLAFLDYLSFGRLDPELARGILTGVAAACRDAGCVLAGGETAEHPGVQRPGDLDLAGFAVGTCAIDELVVGDATHAGDEIVGVASSGPHASGFSLIRHLFARAARPVPPDMLAPTALYVRAVRAVLAHCSVRAMANVCDGGLTENLPRALPAGLGAAVDPGAWPRPGWVAELAGLGCSESELRRVVNVGIGYAFVVAAGEASRAIDALAACGHRAWLIGEVVASAGGDRVLYAG